MQLGKLLDAQSTDHDPVSLCEIVVAGKEQTENAMLPYT